MAVIYPATCGDLSRADAPDCKTNYKGKHVCRSDHDHGGTYHRCFCGVIWKMSDGSQPHVHTEDCWNYNDPTRPYCVEGD